jgi:hypothetical protein
LLAFAVAPKTLSETQRYRRGVLPLHLGQAKGGAMPGYAFILFDFNLPNASTWFCFSLLLAVALFFKFSRLLTIRNWDVLALYLMVPAILILQEARTEMAVEAVSQLAAVSGAADLGGGLARVAALAAPPLRPGLGPPEWIWLGYLMLLGGSGYFFIRCLVDLALVRRPALNPNLNFGGLAWLGTALFACLVAVALRRPMEAGPGHSPDDMLTVVWVRRLLAIAGHVAVVAALVAIGSRHFQDIHSGMAAAAFYLLLPYTAHFFDQMQHVLPMALVLWAVVFYSRPSVAGLLLGIAAGSIYFPALLFPLWFSFYWRRGAARFTVFCLLGIALAIGLTAFIFWLGGPLGTEVQAALNVFDVQQWKLPSTEGFWTGVHWAYRLPVFIAYLAFLIIAIFWPMPKNLAHLIALSAALMIGIQFWFADRGGLYVLWYLPLVLLLVFRPNLADRHALPIVAETDWLHRFGSWLRSWVRRTVKAPEPLTPVG